MKPSYMKNLFMFITAIFCSLIMSAQKIKTGGVTYQIKDGHAIIYEADKNASEITIEGHVTYKNQQYKVTEIRKIRSKYGYYYDALNKSRCPQLKCVTFSNTCTKILSCILFDSNVETILIPNSVKSIEENAFEYCSNLTSVTIPNSVTTIEESAFNGCGNLTSLIIPESVTSIGKHAFSGCSGLTFVTIPNSVTFIGKSAFFGCSSLKSVILPNSLETIESEMFSACSSLKNIVLPDGVMVDKDAFGYINSGKNHLGQFYYCDYYCNNLTNVKYHNGKAATDLLDFLPPKCPFVKNGGKLCNPDFDKPLLAKYHTAHGTSVTPAIQKPEMSIPDVMMENVDSDIPITPKAQPKTFVVIIANEQYTKENAVPYAINDGKFFELYCRQTLGIPQKNIHKVENATLNNMKYEIDWISKVLMAYKGEARAIVYYAGHGIPDEASKTAYLLPVDGYGSNVSTGFSLKELYQVLSEQPSQSVIVFLDACFSGANREGKMMASARGVAIKVKEQKPDGRLVVFSAAQGDETAYPFKEQQHGMFTYYLLKKLKETKGDVTLGDLSDYVTTEVQRQSIVVNGKMQNPKIISSVSMADSWKAMKLK